MKGQEWSPTRYIGREQSRYRTWRQVTDSIGEEMRLQIRKNLGSCGAVVWNEVWFNLMEQTSSLVREEVW